jgi:cytidylate kinase
MAVVTIRGQLGSGTREIAKQVADILRVDYVDREIIAQVAARLGREEDTIVAKEMPPGSLLGRIVEALEKAGSYGYGDGFTGINIPTWQIPLEDDHYAKALQLVVKELARSGSIVIRGRGSQFILKDHPGAFHVLLVAPPDVRVKRVMEELKLDEEVAREEMDRFDNSRREFITRYFKADLEDPIHYDLVVNTGRVGYQAASSIIVRGVGGPFVNPE